MVQLQWARVDGSASIGIGRWLGFNWHGQMAQLHWGKGRWLSFDWLGQMAHYWWARADGCGLAWGIFISSSTSSLGVNIKFISSGTPSLGVNIRFNSLNTAQIPVGIIFHKVQLRSQIFFQVKLRSHWGHFHSLFWRADHLSDEGRPKNWCDRFDRWKHCFFVGAISDSLLIIMIDRVRSMRPRLSEYTKTW